MIMTRTEKCGKLGYVFVFVFENTDLKMTTRMFHTRNIQL